jgi:hypothetical protein
MVIKKLFETTPKSLKLFGIGELTPFFITPKNPLKLGTLTPVSVYKIKMLRIKGIYVRFI